MAIQHKRSLSPQAEPNLMPGQIGVNMADDVLFLRSEGRVFPVTLEKWRTAAAPALGATEGAPLMMTSTGPAWNAALAPSSRVNGRIQVDPSPGIDGLGLPGVQFIAPADPVDLAPNEAVIEPFYVASDAIEVTHIGMSVMIKSPGQVRFAILDMGNNVLATTANTGLTAGGLRTLALKTTLVRGWYKLVAWSASVMRLKALNALSAQQGWNLDQAGAPVFEAHLRTAGAFSRAIVLEGATLSPVTRAQPGQIKSMLLRWAYPESD